MFKRKISGFFTNSSEGNDLTSTEETSSWRKNISPLPHFLLNPRKNQRKDLLFPGTEDEREVSENTRIYPKKKKSEDHVSSQKNKTFPEKRISPPLSHNKNKGYTFTMTKISMWTVAFSLFLLGVLFFILGFLVALYLMGSKPTFISKIEHSVSKHDQILSPKQDKQPSPAASGQQATPASSETESLSMDFNGGSSTSQPALPPSPVASPAPPVSKAPSISQTPASPPPAPELSQPAVSFSKLSPLQKNKPGTFNKGGSNSSTLSLYSLQFGSFTTKDEALKRVNDLISLGYHVVVVRSVNGQNKLLFSVISGSYQTHEQAESALQALGAPEKNFVPLVIRNNPAAVIVYP